MAFLYILHLNTKLAHTQHYAGSTRSLEKRLLAHATGHGARYTEVVAEKGIEWQLAGLYQCNHAVMRRLERQLKDNYRLKRFCDICTEASGVLPGTQKYDLSLVSFAKDSKTIREKATRPAPATYRIAVMAEAKAITKWMIDIMKVERDALGFIPGGSGRGVEDLIRLGRILLAEIGGRPVGYIAHTASKDNARITIHQCCVDDAVRFLGIGRNMLLYLRAKHPEMEMVAKVRFNLAANHFWLRTGFVLACSLPHETSGNLIHHYYLPPYMEIK